MVYRIIFQMVAPTCLRGHIHLDALLSAVNPAMHKKQTIVNCMSAKNDNLFSAPLPLAKVKIHDKWIWCCSSEILPPEAKMSTETYTKRRTPEDVMMLQRRFVRGSTAMRDRMIKNSVILTPTISFLCAADERSKPWLEKLVNDVFEIGSLRKQGYGEVKSVSVWETNFDWKDCLLSPKGKALRRIPIEMLKSASSCSLNTIKPPYWMHAYDEFSIDVGQEMELNPEVECTCHSM